MGRIAFNRGLESRIYWYNTTGGSLNYKTQTRDLTALRSADVFWSDVPVQVERDAINVLKRALTSPKHPASMGRTVMPVEDRVADPSKATASRLWRIGTLPEEKLLHEQ